MGALACLCCLSFPTAQVQSDRLGSGGRHHASCQAQPPLSRLGFCRAPATTSPFPNPSVLPVPTPPALQAAPRSRRAGRAVGSHQPLGTELALTCLPAPAGSPKGRAALAYHGLRAKGGRGERLHPRTVPGGRGGTGVVPARCPRCDGEMFVCQKQGLQPVNLGRILWFLFIYLFG